MTWKPSNQPIRYDRARVARTKPIEDEIKKLGLPLIRFRKLNGILNALVMQVEDGGDHPEVNRLLLEALRAALRHQVGERRSREALRAIEIVERYELERWEQVRAGTLPPIELTAEEQLSDLMQEGYRLLESGKEAAACDRWLKAWGCVLQMATPEMRTETAFDDANPGMMQLVYNWCSDLEMELHNAGVEDPSYYKHRVRYVREFLAQFPNVDELRYCNFRRAEGEALWALGRMAEGEAVFQALVEKLPDSAWGYIGWSDQYSWGRDRTPDYARAEALLLKALERPKLDDRDPVLERLVRLYDEWDEPEKRDRCAAEMAEIRAPRQARFQPSPIKQPRPPQPPAAKSKRSSGRRKRKKRRR